MFLWCNHALRVVKQGGWVQAKWNIVYLWQFVAISGFRNPIQLSVALCCLPTGYIEIPQTVHPNILIYPGRPYFTLVSVTLSTLQKSLIGDCIF